MNRHRLILALVSLAGVIYACAPYHQENARYQLSTGNPENAAYEIEAALRSDPKNLQLKHEAAEIFTRRGQQEYDRGEMIAAQADFMKALYYEPTYAQAADYLGLIAFSQHDWQNAISYGKKAAGLTGQPDPTYVLQAEEELRKVQAGGIKPYRVPRRRHYYRDTY